MGQQRLFPIAVLSALVFALGLHAQPAHRVKDLNSGGLNLTPPTGLTVAGGRLFFVADDGPHGPELWVSDGSGAGTTRIPGTSGATQLMKAGARVFFMRFPQFELWTSDGTPSGTTFVKTMTQLPSEWVDSGGTLFFSAFNPVGNELWKSDGTAGGTLRVKELDPGTGPLSVQQLIASTGLVYFYAHASTTDALWRSDGTAAGTFAVQTTPVQVVFTSRPMLTSFGNSIFFSGFDTAHGAELWISDGTDAGTTLFRDLEPGSGSSSPQEFTQSGARLFFTAQEPGLGWRLWRTDGSPANTTAVGSLVPGFADLTDVSGRLAFRTLDNPGVWASDGTDAGTVQLRGGDAANLAAAGSRLFFTVASQLWVSDLTPSGTHLVRSFAGSLDSQRPPFLAEFGGLLYFFADDGVHGPQLWQSDGTTSGTTLVAILRPGPSSSFPHDFREMGGAAFFFAAGAESHGLGTSDLWRTDGTEAGTTPILTGLSPRSGPSAPAATSRKLFWIEGRVLTMSDGTVAGTEPVPGSSGLIFSSPPVCTAETAFFFGRRQNGDTLLLAADGSPTGTRALGIFSGGAGLPVPFGERIVFLATVPPGEELWQSDGTPEGTAALKTLSTRGNPQCNGLPRRLGREVVFLADDGSTGCNVWRSDGTAEGTVPLAGVGGGSSASMDPLGSARGVFVFTNFTDVWRTDGTPKGTFLLKSFTISALAEPPGAGTREGVYFSIRTNGTPDTTQQLWVTDGTVPGTVLLHDFKAGGEDASIVSLTTANGRLLMTVSTAGALSLWTSDGTPAGTGKVQDDAGASDSALVVAEVLPYRGMTLFAGTDPWAGTELWAMDGASFAAPVPPTSLSVFTPCRILDTRLGSGFLGGPAIAANAPRLFPVGGTCGIPATARAIAANVTVTGATSDGLLQLHASDIGAPDAALINFRAGQTRANNATIALGPDAEFTVRFVASAGAGEVHVIVDVVGWFE